MVHSDIIRKRLSKLEEYLGILEGVKACSEEAFNDPGEIRMRRTVSPFRDRGPERHGGYVIAEEDLGVVEWQRDIPRILADRSRLDTSLHDVWLCMIGFRDILVHGYLAIDRRQVYTVLQTGLADLRAIAATFARYLE